MYMIRKHTDKIFKSSIKNKNQYIPDGYNDRINNLLNSLPDSSESRTQEISVVKHKKISEYKSAFSAAAAIVLIMGGVYTYVNFSSSGKKTDDGKDNPEATAITTVSTTTEITTSNPEEQTKETPDNTVLPIGTDSYKYITAKNGDIAGNTGINPSNTEKEAGISAEQSEKKSDGNKKDAEKTNRVQSASTLPVAQSTKATVQKTASPKVTAAKATESKEKNTVAKTKAPKVTLPSPPEIIPPATLPPAAEHPKTPVTKEEKKNDKIKDNKHEDKENEDKKKNKMTPDKEIQQGKDVVSEKKPEPEKPVTEKNPHERNDEEEKIVGPFNRAGMPVPELPFTDVIKDILDHEPEECVIPEAVKDILKNDEE